MKKINVHPDLLNILTQIVANNEERRTKVARVLVEAVTIGLDENILIEDYPDYFNFAHDSKKLISYFKKDKMIGKIKEIEGVDELTDDHLNGVREMFYTNQVVRTRCKASKFITRLFPQGYRINNFSGQDVEWFTNQYASIIANEIDFKLVKGEDIRKYYHIDLYERNAPQGTLIGSCMAADGKQKFLDIYTKNDNVNLLVALNADGKVLGRAIVWENVTIKNRATMDVIQAETKFMDRIYHTHDWISEKFTTYARENEMYTKYQQTFNDTFRIVDLEGNEKECVIEVPLENLKFRYLPYLDTLFIPNYERGFITNKTDGYDSNSQMRSHDAGTPSKVWDSIDGKLVRSDQSKWGKHIESWIHRDDNVRVASDNFHKKLCQKDRLNGYITPKDTEVKCVITGDSFAERNMIHSEHHSGLIHKKEAVETVDAGIVHKNESVESKYLGSRLSKDGSVHLAKLDDYLPKTVLDSGVDIENFEKVIETLDKLKGESKPTFSESSTFVFEF